MDYLVKIRSVQTPLNGQFSIGANKLTAVILSSLFFTVKIPFRLFYDCFMSVLLSFLHTCEVLMSRVRFFSMITPSLPAAPVKVLLQTSWLTACNKRTQTPLQPTNSLSTHSIRYHCFTDCFYTQTATFLPPLYPKPPSFQRYDTAMNWPHFTTVFALINYFLGSIITGGFVA